MPSSAFEALSEGQIRAAHGSGHDVKPLFDAHTAQPLAQRALKAVVRKFRVLSWLPSYSPADLLGDVRGGLTVAVLLVPQAIAHALLVEVPPYMGLYTSFVPLVVFALFTSSTHLSVGPFALICIVVAAVAEEIVPDDRSEAEYVNAVLVISLVTGAMQLAMGALRLGVISTFLADPSVEGFTSAVALIIMSSQLKYLLGVPLPHGTMPETVVRALLALVRGRVNWWAFGMTALAFVLMTLIKELGARCCRPGIPIFEQLIVVVLFTAVQALAPLPVETIGELPRGLPVPAAPVLPESFDEFAPYLTAGLVVAFTSFLVSMSIARAFAARGGYAVSGNQELLALGLANCAGCCFGAFPISGSFSRSAVAASVGVRTPLHGVVQAGVVALTLLFITPLFRTLPFAVLAAIIITALRALIDFGAAALLWRSSKPDFALWLIAFATTCLFGVEAGLVLSIGCSLGLLVLQTSRPRWAVLGLLPGTGVFRDMTRYPTAASPPHVLVFRFDAPLHFANVGYFAKLVRTRLSAMAAQGAEPTHLVLDCSSMFALDASANACFRQLVVGLKKKGMGVLLAGTRRPFREALRRFGTLELVGEHNLFPHLAQAVELGCARPPEVLRGERGESRASLVSHVRSYGSVDDESEDEVDPAMSGWQQRARDAAGAGVERELSPEGEQADDDDEGFDTASERSDSVVERTAQRRRQAAGSGTSAGLRRAVSFADADAGAPPRRVVGFYEMAGFVNATDFSQGRQDSSEPGEAARQY